MDKVKLNLGCGATKLEGFVNIDAFKTEAVDVLCDFSKDKLPFDDSSVDFVLMSHVIEHISKSRQVHVLNEIWRVLKDGEKLFLAYPEFKVCALNYINNYKGHREYWEATIYGRQSHPGDAHVTLMDTDRFVDILLELGFSTLKSGPEASNPHNTILICQKIEKPISRENLISREVLQKVYA